MPRITHQKLLRIIEATGNVAKIEPALKITASNSVRRLVLATGKDTGNTRRGWTTPKKVSNILYKVFNAVTTPMVNGKRYNIVRMLDEGTKDIKKDKLMYIPISKRGRRKISGAPIPKDFRFGVDFVLSKERKGLKAKNFIEKEKRVSSRELGREAIKIVRNILRG